jgi:hypothetical protein
MLALLAQQSRLPGQEPVRAQDPALPELMTKEIVAAVKKGLDALVKAQQPDGRLIANWEGGTYPAVMTSIAGMAWLASGSTPEEGPYARSVRKAMLYLLALAESRGDGLIAGGDEIRCTYGHGWAMMFLANCYGMEPNVEYQQRVRRALEKAIDLAARGQSRLGGWLYHPAGGGDEGSTTSCVLQGLRACRNVGIKVPKETIERAVGYLKYTQNPDGGIAYSSVFRGASRPAISAAGIACFYSAGLYDRGAGGQGGEAGMVDKLVRYVRNVTRNADESMDQYFYSHFYLAQTWYQRGAEWTEYYRKMSRKLLKTQAPEGTWLEKGVGPTFGTAMACIILQVPYGYLLIAER